MLCKADIISPQRAQKSRYIYNAKTLRRKGVVFIAAVLRELAEPAKTLRGFWLRQRTQRFISSCSFHCASLCALCLARTSAMPFVRLRGQTPVVLKNSASLRNLRLKRRLSLCTAFRCSPALRRRGLLRPLGGKQYRLLPYSLVTLRNLR